jgi:V/A-type H+-transporting ATPase subunit F
MADTTIYLSKGAPSMKIGVVGDRDSILCYKAFGMDIFPASESEPEESRKIVDQLAKESYGVIFVTEQIADTIGETIDRYNKTILPAVILIPGVKGSLGIGSARIRDNVEKAVGMNILD